MPDKLVLDLNGQVTYAAACKLVDEALRDIEEAIAEDVANEHPFHDDKAKIIAEVQRRIDAPETVMAAIAAALFKKVPEEDEAAEAVYRWLVCRVTYWDGPAEGAITPPDVLSALWRAVGYTLEPNGAQPVGTDVAAWVQS